MSEAWLFSFGWLAAVLAIFCALGYILIGTLQRLLYWLMLRSEYMGLLVYCLLFFPAVVLHELSHALFATVLGARVSGISLLPTRVCTSPGQPPTVLPPHVRHSGTDFLRGSLVGVGPVITGTTTVALLSWLGLHYRAPLYYFNGLDQLVAATSGFLRQLNLRSTSTLVIVYLVFSVGNVMLPSGSDRRQWPSTIAFLMTAAWLMCYFGVRPTLSYAASQWWLQNVNYLIFVFVFLAIMDVVFVVPLALFRLLFSHRTVVSSEAAG